MPAVQPTSFLSDTQSRRRVATARSLAIVQTRQTRLSQLGADILHPAQPLPRHRDKLSSKETSCEVQHAGRLWSGTTTCRCRAQVLEQQLRQCREPAISVSTLS